MKSTSAIIAALALAFAASAPWARGEIGENEAADVRAEADDAYQMAFWDVAARKYRALLAGESLPADERAALTVRLAECLVRAGHAADALAMLAGEPDGLAGAIVTGDAIFWRAQALAGLGRFGEAVDAFDVHLGNPDAPHRLEAAFTSANLQLSLNQASGAMRTLASFAEGAAPAEAARANLRRAAILLDSGFPEDAAAIIPDEESLPEDARPLGRHTRANLLLATGDAETAAGIFATLLDDPTGQSLLNHHGAAVGLADAIHETSGPDAATRSLLAFLQENPAPPMLDAAFRRILEWLPDAPTASDPTLAALTEWIPQPAQLTRGFIPSGNSAAAAWPAPATRPDDIAAFAIFTRAAGLHRVDSPSARAEAGVLLSRLRANFPSHYLTRRSFILEARWLMDAGERQAAIERLGHVAESSRTRRARGEAMFFQALAHAADGDETSAAELFDAASELLRDGFAEAAAFNAALARIQQHPASAEVPDMLPNNLRAQLVLERGLAMEEPAESIAAIESFLRDHPDHPRAPEARLAAAERALFAIPPDVSFARAQVEMLLSSGDRAATPGPRDAVARIALIQLRIADLTTGNDEDSTAAIEIANRIIRDHPESAAATEATLTLGRQLFRSGNFNDARLAFQRLATSNAENPDGDTALTQAAWLLAARAASLGATAQSREEALDLFDRAIATPGDAPLGGIATLEKARLMIDLNRLAPAVDFLREARAALDAGDPLHLPAGLLLGEAIYARGAGDPESLAEALAIYDELLDKAADQPTLFNRLQYLRGITLERLPDPEAPHQNRTAEAIEAYYSVLQRAGDAPPAEWEWFERCAFGALALLEKSQNWQAAINLARKIAAFNGPRANDAAERANQLQLRHMIWED